MLSYHDVTSDMTSHVSYRQKLSVDLKSVRDITALCRVAEDLNVELGFGSRANSKKKILFWEVVSFLEVALAEKGQGDYQDFYRLIHEMFRDNLIYCNELEKAGWAEAFIGQLRQFEFSRVAEIYKAVSSPENRVGEWLRKFVQTALSSVFGQVAGLFGLPQSQYSDCFTGEMCTRSWHKFQWGYIVRAVEFDSKESAQTILSTLQLPKLTDQMWYEERLQLRDAIDSRSEALGQETQDLLDGDDFRKFFEKEPDIYWGRTFGYRPVVDSAPSSGRAVEMQKMGARE